ncbi:deoxyribodipyrimidine photolyase, partial [Rhodobacteraceae bacterium WD3A24]
MQRFEDAPEIEARCLHRAFEQLRPRVPEAALLDAWAQGRTGLPLVDACMRYLRATGWLNFCMRAMVVAVASYHLWLDWRATGAVLARLFTDYEPGIHWNQMQIRSGTTGIDALRLYDPVRQGRDHDPGGAFTRRWVPELGEVPDGFLQEPWKWPGARRLLGRAYPEPVIGPAAAERAARAALRELRQSPGFDAEAARLARRHAGAGP